MSRATEYVNYLLAQASAVCMDVRNTRDIKKINKTIAEITENTKILKKSEAKKPSETPENEHLKMTQ